MADRRGRPVVGAIAGLLLGVFTALDLVLLGLLPTNAPLLTALPVVGLVAGVAVGRTAAFAGLRRARTAGDTGPGAPDVLGTEAGA